MTNIVGTDLNQAPTNADLGTLAFQDAAGVGELNVITLTANALRVNNDVSTAVPVVNFNFGAGQNFYGTNCSFTRSSIASYFDRFGNMQYADIDEPRIDYDPFTGECKGLLIEGSNANLFLYSDTPATQDITVTADIHTVSFYGTGSIVLSGAAEATVVGAGTFPTRTVYTFTPTAGVLTLTVSGDVQKVQLEQYNFATSYIPTYASPITRGFDVAHVNLSSIQIPALSMITESSHYADYNGTSLNKIVSYVYAGPNTRHGVRYNNTGYGNFTIVYDNVDQIVDQLDQDAQAYVNTFTKRAFAVTENDFFGINGDGVKFKDSTVSYVGDSSFDLLTLGKTNNQTGFLYGHIKQVTLYNKRLSNKELTELVS